MLQEVVIQSCLYTLVQQGNRNNLRLNLYPSIVLFGAIKGQTVFFLDLEHSRHNLLLQSTKRGTAKQQRSISEAMNTLKDPHIINFSERSTEHANVTISFIDDDQTKISVLINVRLAHRFVCEINGMVENNSIKLRLQGV